MDDRYLVVLLTKEQKRRIIIELDEEVFLELEEFFKEKKGATSLDFYYGDPDDYR